MVSFIKQQIQNQKKKTVFFPAVRKARRISIAAREEEYKWGAPDYKLYPSSLKFTMCPKEHIKGLEKFSGINDLDALYRVKRGSAVHAELQEDFLLSDKMWSEDMWFPMLYQDYPDAPPYVSLRKSISSIPEVAFWDPESGLSGRLDGVLNIGGEPVPLEIKTTSQAPDKWLGYIEANLPSKQHLCQGSIYCYMMNKHKVFPGKTVTQFNLSYINLLMPPGDMNAECEFMQQYSGELEEKTDALVQAIILERNAYIAGEETNCTYDLCWHHHRGGK